VDEDYCRSSWASSRKSYRRHFSSRLFVDHAGVSQLLKNKITNTEPMILFHIIPAFVRIGSSVFCFICMVSLLYSSMGRRGDVMQRQSPSQVSSADKDSIPLGTG